MSCGYVLQDLDAVEALIQGLVIFQGGVLMVSTGHFVNYFIISLDVTPGCMADYSFGAGESRRASNIWERWRVVGSVRRQSHTFPWDISRLQEDA